MQRSKTVPGGLSIPGIDAFLLAKLQTKPKQQSERTQANNKSDWIMLYPDMRKSCRETKRSSPNKKSFGFIKHR